jgi:aspartyl-tRNA synthetase
MAFADHDDVIAILSDMLVSIVKDVIKNNKDDLEQLKVKLSVPQVKTITYSEAVDKINKKGTAMKFGEDFSREHEKLLAEIYGEAMIIKGYPTAIRAFYSMPSKENPEISNSFDLLYKGLEMASGAQRIHIPELLIKALKSRNLDPKEFEPYINAMRCGAPPHAGWSLGLERLTTVITGMDNIRECSLFPRDRKRITP